MAWASVSTPRYRRFKRAITIPGSCKPLNSDRMPRSLEHQLMNLAGKLALIITFLFLMVTDLSAQDSTQRVGLHFQFTTITQQHTRFHAPYEGDRSLQRSEQAATSLTATIFAGVKLARHAEFYLNPEMAGGTGLSGATGVGGFTNGETFRVGNPRPAITMARAFVRQIIPLSSESVWREEAANNLHIEVPEKYIAIHAGKLSLADYFDFNTYSHDPRDHFINWALMSNGAWDYAADTRGYTWGIVGELILKDWELRLATALLPTYANGPKMNWDYAHSYSWQVEGVRYWGTSRRGALRALLFMNHGPMGRYADAIAMPVPDVSAVRAPGRTNYGVGLNVEQPVNAFGGLFGRASWSSGKAEIWCFTEIERSLSGGYVIHGAPWQRSDDVLGLAFVVNGLSGDHRRYLEAGGYGFMLGDGKLNYATENIFEAYYKFTFPRFFMTFTPDYQFVMNPAYNRDRGPVHFFALRFHVDL